MKKRIKAESFFTMRSHLNDIMQWSEAKFHNIPKPRCIVRV